MDTLVSFVEQYGLWLVWANVFLTQIGLPVPAVPTLVVAGALATGDALSLAAFGAGSVVIAVAADALWYAAGVRYGAGMVERLCRFTGRDARGRRRIETALKWGAGTLIVAKFIPGVALLAPPLAGLARMRPGTFIAADALGAALWAALPLALGAAYPGSVREAVAALAAHSAWIGFVLTLALAVTAAARWRLRQAQRRAADSKRNAATPAHGGSTLPTVPAAS